MSLSRRRWVIGPLTVPLALGVSGIALVEGYLLTHMPFAAAALALVPLGLWLFLNQRLAAILLAAAIPFPQDLTLGRLGLNVALSDILLVVIAASLASQALVGQQPIGLRVLGPLRPAVLQFVALMMVLAIYHFTFTAMLNTVQRFVLFLFPLLIGAAIAFRGWERTVLRTYVIAATALAATWPLLFDSGGFLSLQKNPAGGFIAVAVLLLVGVKSLRSMLPWCLPVLVVGLLWTLSRGAIGSVGIGLLALLVVQAGWDRGRSLLVLVPGALLTVFAFQALPEPAQERTLTISADQDTEGAGALRYRQRYLEDADEVIDAHPVTGVGVGEYIAGRREDLTLTTDPHNVLYLQAAEGGYPLAISFIVLVAGVSAVVVVRARQTALGPAAVAVMLATVAHGIVDVYWVRGTPVMSWLVVGIALGAAARDPHRQASP